MTVFETSQPIFESELMNLTSTNELLFILTLKRNSEIKFSEANEMMHLYQSLQIFLQERFPLILVPPGAFNLDLEARKILAPEKQDEYMFAKACVAESSSNKGLIRMTSKIMDCQSGSKVEIFDSLEDSIKWCQSQMKKVKYAPKFRLEQLKKFLSTRKEMILSTSV